MNKEKNTQPYANFNFMTTAPKSTEKNGPRAGVIKSGKDLRGGKK